MGQCMGRPYLAGQQVISTPDVRDEGDDGGDDGHGAAESNGHALVDRRLVQEVVFAATRFCDKFPQNPVKNIFKTGFFSVHKMKI